MPSQTTTGPGSQGADRPTLLMVGAGDPMDAALKLALDRHGLFVETVGHENLRRSVHMTAPDLIFLVGDAASDGGAGALGELAADPSTATVPVVLLAADEKLESRLHGFRHGAMAVVPRSPSADAIAREVRRLAREMSEHFEEKTGEIGEATFDELVDIVQKELRSGILSVHAPGHKGGPMRVVLGAGRPVAEAVQEFVARLSPHVKGAAEDSMYYQFHASAGGPVELLGSSATGGGTADAGALEEVRLLLVDDDPARADTLAQELRARGAIVFVTDTAGRGLARAAGLDPHAALVDAAGLEGRGFEVVRAIRKDPRMRWASILVAPWAEILPEEARTPDMELLAGKIEPLLAPERDLAERAARGEPFDTRLEATGPSRLLRVLVSSGATLHLTVRSAKGSVEVDLAQGLVVGATARVPPAQDLEGIAALGVLLALTSGRVHVERRPNPSVANVMSPVEEALSAASAEPSRVPPSMPPSGLDALPAEDDVDDAAVASTRVKDLAGLAAAGEVLLDDDQKPTMRPPEPPVDPASSRRTPHPPPEAPVGGPVAAGERRRPPAKRKATLVMGAPAIPPDKPSAPAGRRDPTGETPTVRPPADVSPALEASPAAEAPSAKATPPRPPPRLKQTMVGMQPIGVAPPDAGAPAPPAPPSPAPPDAPIAGPPSSTAGEPPAPPPAPPSAAAPTDDPFAAERREAAREPTEPIVTEKRGRGGRGVLIAITALAGVVLVAALGLIGYRYSGARIAALDEALATVGLPAPDRDAGGAAGTDRSEVEPEPDEPGPDPSGEREAAGGAEADAIDPAPDPVADPTADGEPTAEVESAAVVEDEGEVEGLPAEAEAEREADPAPDGEGEASAEAAPETPPEAGADEDDGSTAEELVERADRAGNSDLAERLYRRALQIDPQEHHAMVGLARLLMDRGENAEAAELLRGAIRRRPRRAAYRIWLGDALGAAGNGAGAQRAWQEALEIDPDNRQARRRLGQ